MYILNFIILFILLIPIVNGDSHNKYSKEANTQFKDKPFRMQKLNLYWEKASKKLEGKKLKTLYEDLKHQDKDELALKRLKAEDGDKDGMKAAQVRKQLNLILAKYDLNWEDTNQATPFEPDADFQQHEKQLFKDKKLDKLWKKAHKAGLSEEQMKILKEELKHYEEKMGQYHELISELNHKEHKENERRNNIGNHIDSFLEEENRPKDSTIEETHNKLKEKHVELKEEYRRLSDMVYDSSVGLGRSHITSEFEEERANKLWNLALKSDFTDEELDTLRDELLHFQTRIKKLKFFEAQLENDQMAGKRPVEPNEPISDSLEGHQKHIAGKVKELNYKVNKIHTTIEDRILRRHSEL